MIKGPFNGPRPFAEHRFVFDPHEMSIYIVNTGPMGAPRPFSKINPEVEDVRIKECIMSEGGRAFGASSIAGEGGTKISELPVEQKLAALVRAEKWCRGLLDKTADGELSEQEVNQKFDKTVRQLRDEVESKLSQSELADIGTPDVFDEEAEIVPSSAVETIPEGEQTPAESD